MWVLVKQADMDVLWNLNLKTNDRETPWNSLSSILFQSHLPPEFAKI